MGGIGRLFPAILRGKTSRSYLGAISLANTQMMCPCGKGGKAGKPHDGTTKTYQISERGIDKLNF